VKVRFLAREDFVVREAGVAPRVGEATRYYGRRFDAATRGYPATEDGVEFDADSEDGRKCIRACRDNPMPLWPADEATAALCGVKFTPVVFADGAWVAAPPESPTKAKK
jgi:hypothetical protein